MAMLEGVDHRFTVVNAAYSNMFLAGKNVVGKTVLEVLPEAKEQGFVELLDRVLRTGVPERGIESPFFRDQPDGSKRRYILNFVYQPAKDSSGKVTGVLALVIDVTAQVEAREVVENQQKWLESILNELPVALFLIDPKINKVGFHNHAAVDLFGYPITGKTVEQRYSEVKIFDRSGAVVPADELPSARASRGEQLNEEYSLETPKARFDVAALSRTIPESYGHAETALLVLQDVTAVREKEEHYRLLTELAPQMPFVADADGNISYFSPQWYEYIGQSPGSSEGWKWKDIPIHHPDDLERAIATWSHCVKTGTRYEIEYRLRRADGVYRWHLGRAEPIRNVDGRITKWIGTNVDIDDQKNLQTDLETARIQAETASAAKSAFLANMSHEIRTPLGAILGFTELLRSTSQSKEGQDFIEVIERNGHGLTKVIDDILDLSKVESGKLELEMLPFSLVELMSDVVLLFSEKANSKGLKIEFQAPSNNLNVISDPSRVRQILINLVGNAVKFTERGSVTLSVSSRPLRTGYETVEIFVSDTGPGLSPDQQEKLFEPFVQADQSTSRKFGGTGLGLALSRKLARALDGDVHIQTSAVGSGSTFVISLDMRLSELPQKTRALDAQAAMEVKPQQLLGSRILVVDDSNDNRVLLNRFLKKEGAEVIEAACGEDAIAMSRTHEFDVVLMDIQMPGMDGYEALRGLRSTGCSKPVIALTAHAMLEEKKRALGAGFVDHVTKPINQKVLVNAISILL